MPGNAQNAAPTLLFSWVRFSDLTLLWRSSLPVCLGPSGILRKSLFWRPRTSFPASQILSRYTSNGECSYEVRRVPLPHLEMLAIWEILPQIHGEEPISPFSPGRP
jgi:hypothetical protein